MPMIKTPDPNPFIFLVKQEIFTNIIKVYKAVMVLGMSGTGKTITAINVAKEIGKINYFSGLKFNHEQIRALCANIQFPNVVDDLKSVEGIIILDNAQGFSVDMRNKLATILKTAAYDKLIVISPYFPSAKELFLLTDVAVRFTSETVNVITFDNKDVNNGSDS